jgi:hypothetical protein
MNVNLAFFANKDLQIDEFKKYICTMFARNENDVIFLNENIMDYIHNNNLWDEYTEGEKKYVSFCKYKGDFFSYVHIDGEYVSIEEEVEILKKLCALFNFQCINIDEGCFPYARILVNELGEAFSICLNMDEFDDNDRVVIYGYDYKPIGSFATIERENLEEIRTFFAKIYNIDEYLIEVAESEATFYDTDNKMKFIHHNGTDFFRYCYSITISEVPKWNPILKKSEDWIAVMKIYADLSKKEVCIRHEYFDKIRYISGGSDSEAYCLYLKDNHIEKIMFKKLREKW